MNSSGLVVSNMIPHMMDQIIPESTMCCTVSRCMVHMKKISQVCVRSRLGHNQITFKFPPLVVHTIIVLLLNDYAVHDHTSNHVLQHYLLPCRTRVPNNSPARLQHIKCPLHNLPSSFLIFSKPILFLVFRIVDCLHKCGAGRIDSIG
jgi:hypothetical protein